MMHILHLDASPRGERSISHTLTKEFITAWKRIYPNDVIAYRNLGHHSVPPIDEAGIAAAFCPPDQLTPDLSDALRISDELIDEFTTRYRRR